VGDDHARQRLEERLDDVALTRVEQPLEPVVTWRGVKPRATSLRKAVWSGGSSMTIGRLSARPIVSSSSYSTVRPCAEENVAVSTAAASTSTCRLST
jgi:hypothetical protein